MRGCCPCISGTQLIQGLLVLLLAGSLAVWSSAGTWLIQGLLVLLLAGSLAVWSSAPLEPSLLRVGPTCHARYELHLYRVVMTYEAHHLPH